jgi:hypothetical protein
MSVTLTYDATLSRVRIDATGLATADQATVERSTDQIRWTTVRGGTAVGVTAGVLDLAVDDYEFSPNVVNYYRVRAISTAAVSFRASSAAVLDANAAGTSTLSPTLPAGIVADEDLLVIYASIRNSGTGTVDTPAGWTAMMSFGNIALLGRRYRAGDAAPTVTFSGGVANATVLAKMLAFPHADIAPAATATLLNASAQNVAYPALTVPADDQLILVGGWKQDDWTGAAQLAGMTEIQDSFTTLGDDVAAALDYVVQTTKANITAGSFTITGGASAISRGFVMALAHAAFMNEQTNSITPTITDVWLKSVARPFLNQEVELGGDTLTIARPARSGVFDIVGRSLPIAVSDVRSSRRYTLTLRTETDDDADGLELILASGDVLYLQAPPDDDCPIPSGVYLRAGDTTQMWPVPADPVRLFEVPMTEVAAPGPDVVGATVTWQTVLNNYATWSALIADKASWAEVLTLIGDASEVIIP